MQEMLPEKTGTMSEHSCVALDLTLRRGPSPETRPAKGRPNLQAVETVTVEILRTEIETPVFIIRENKGSEEDLMRAGTAEEIYDISTDIQTGHRR